MKTKCEKAREHATGRCNQFCFGCEFLGRSGASFVAVENATFCFFYSSRHYGELSKQIFKIWRNKRSGNTAITLKIRFFEPVQDPVLFQLINVPTIERDRTG